MDDGIRAADAGASALRGQLNAFRELAREKVTELELLKAELEVLVRDAVHGGAVGLLPVFVGSIYAGAAARVTTPLVTVAVLMLTMLWRVVAADSGAARQQAAADPGALMVACGIGLGLGAAVTSGAIWLLARSVVWARALLLPQGVS